MLKNNKAVTLISLVVAIVILSILASVTIITTNSLIIDTTLKTVTANMYLVKSKVETIYDEYSFSESENILKGDQYKADLSKYGITSGNNNWWYVWDSEVLSELGFDSDILANDSKFIVNYLTGEVIYTPGCKTEEGIIVYTLTDMTK